MPESRISKELHRRIFELTLALYRVTDFFPQGEVLRKQLREKANEIFGGVTEYGYSPNTEQDAIALIARIQAMKGYLGIARSMRFVRPINLSILEREYNFLADFFVKELAEKEETSKEADRNIVKNQVKEKPQAASDDHPASNQEKAIEVEELPTWHEFSQGEEKSDTPESGLTRIADDINERQKIILEHLKSAPQAKISDFHSLFGAISSKTIQRDLQSLVEKEFLKKTGEKRWTTYTLNLVRGQR